MCDYKYCFQDAVIKWPGSVYDSGIYLLFLRVFIFDTIPPRKKVLVNGTNPIQVFLLGAPAYPLLPFLTKDFSGSGENSEQKVFSEKFSHNMEDQNYEFI